jgi:hypothetical protein
MAEGLSPWRGGRTGLPVTTKAERWKSIQRWALWLAVALAAAVIYLLIWYGPDLLARHGIENVTGPLRAFRFDFRRRSAR